MKNVFTARLVVNVLLLLSACTKTGVDFTYKPVRDQPSERIIEKASYSRWLSASVPFLVPGNIYKVISGTPSALTFDIFKNGKVLVFGRANELSQPYSLPFDHYYRSRYMITRRRTYFTYHVANITVYDSLVSRYIYYTWPFSAAFGYYNNEFRCIIVPPALKTAANAAGIDWNDYNAVTSYFKIAP